MQDLPPAGGGFLIPAGAVALDIAEAWPKVGAESLRIPPKMVKLAGPGFRNIVIRMKRLER